MLSVDAPRRAATLLPGGEPIGLAPAPRAGDGPRLWTTARSGARRVRSLTGAPADGLLLLQDVAPGPEGALVALVLHAPADAARPAVARLIVVPAAASEPARLLPPLRLPPGTDPAMLHLVTRHEAARQEAGRQEAGPPSLVWPGGARALEAGTLAPAGPPAPLPRIPGTPLAFDADGALLHADADAVGRLVPAGGRMVRLPGGIVLLRTDSAGQTVRLAGSGFEGATDGTGAAADLRAVRALRVEGCAVQWLEAGPHPSARLVLRRAGC